MALITKAPRGTEDNLPEDIAQWHTVEKIAAETAASYGFKEIRTPTFEHTPLFQRGVGETTDVVQKEMYTFNDKKGRSITLRPEGTAGAVRAAIEHGLLNQALPQKLYYLTNCFRYEAPQSGRLREFHQFGIELLGAASAAADAEVIALADDVLRRLSLTQVELQINSIGCPECRAKYLAALTEYYSAYTGELCPTCLVRLEKNPMRLLDCKVERCQEIAQAAPEMPAYLCPDCKAHFDQLKQTLDALGIAYTENPRIVRGLDYYTNTVFEFVTTKIGAQGTVCGGGRYNGLIAELGGAPTPALGFAMGIERLILLMKAEAAEFMPEKACDLYIAGMDSAAQLHAAKLVRQLRATGFWAETDLAGRGLKAQMKYADKLGARYSMVLGSNELETKQAALKNMQTGETVLVAIDEAVFAERVNMLLGGG